MLKSRVSSAIDTGRLANAVSRPGIDPRVWVSFAIVQKVVIDPLEGVFVDVLLMPKQVNATCRVGTEYAGDGFGVYAPLEVDDEVLVEAANGDPNNGYVITRRLHSASDPPPAQAVTNPDDLLIHVRSGKTCRIVVTGGGSAVIEARDDGHVQLGSEDATRGVARLADSTVISGADLTALQTNLDARYLIGGGAPLTDVNGVISSASDKVRSS